MIRRRTTTYGRTTSPYLRAAVAVAAMAVTALLVVRVAHTAGSAARVAVVVGAWALALQVIGLLRWPRAAGPAAALLGVMAALALLPRENRGLAAELVVLFLTATELAGWAAGLRSAIPETAASVGRQLGQIGAVVAAGGVITATVGWVAGSSSVGLDGRAALVIGVLAAVLPVGLLASRRWRSAA